MDDQDIICPCSGTRVGRIRTRFQDGLRSLEQLADATGVCTGCAGCECDVASLIAQLEQEFPETAAIKPQEPGKIASNDHG